MEMDKLGFWSFANAHPDALAVVEPDGTEHTAGALLAAANQAVAGLRALGLERGSTFAIMLANGAPVLELFMATAQAGFYMTPINTHLAAPEVAYILQDSDSRVLICSAEHADLCRKARDEAGLPADRCFAVGDAEGFRPYAELKAGQPTDNPAERFAGTSMTYTSGTTGRPKGIRRPMPPIPPEMVSSRQALFLSLFGITPGSKGVHIVAAPLYHTAVVNFATNHLHLGHTVVLMGKWTPEAMLEKIDRYKVTSSHMVPTMFNRLLKLPDEVKARYDVSSLSHMIHSAAPCPVETKRKMLDWWGDCIYEYYAASEGGGTLATPQDWRKKPGTVGKAWPISQIRILDDDKQPVPTGTPGTIWMAMGEHTFKYHKAEEKTDKAWHDGFFTVGDIGYLDEDGYLFLCDRKIDMIISGGVNISPAEIEAALIQHPSVGDVAVFGVPHDDWGESVKAVVEPVSGVEPDDALRDELNAWCAEQLAKYKRPRSIDFIESMPRDPNGKLYKRKLRDPYWEGRDRAI